MNMKNALCYGLGGNVLLTSVVLLSSWAHGPLVDAPDNIIINGPSCCAAEGQDICTNLNTKKRHLQKPSVGPRAGNHVWAGDACFLVVADVAQSLAAKSSSFRCCN